MTSRWTAGLVIAAIVLASVVVAFWPTARSGTPSVGPGPRSTTPAPEVVLTPPPDSRAGPAATPPSPPALAGVAGAPIELGFREAVEDSYSTDAIRQIRREIWQGLVDFAKEANLTEAQWRRFLTDLHQSAVMAGHALDDRVMERLVPGDYESVSEDLGHELEDTLAGYLSDSQMKIFRMRFHANVLPGQLARGNILQDPSHPEVKAWSLDGDDVLEEDRYRGYAPWPRAP